jgi:hypothetical protein
MCCQHLSQCSTAIIKIVAGTTTYQYFLRKDGNYATLGQCSRQINNCHIIHCNLTSSPAGNIVVLDRLPTCIVPTVTGTTPTTVTVE